MRMRALLAVAGAATLLVSTAPSHAGTGSSTWCDDGVGYREIPIVTSPITLGAEISYPPGGDHQQIAFCYSTSAPGQPAAVTSGALVLDIWTATGGSSPGVYVALICVPDHVSGIGPACNVPNSLNVAPGDLDISTPNSTICLLSLGSGCVLWVPGLKIKTGGDPSRPLVAIQLLGVAVPVDVSPQCVALVVTCP